MILAVADKQLHRSELGETVAQTCRSYVNCQFAISKGFILQFHLAYHIASISIISIFSIAGQEQTRKQKFNQK